MNLVTAILLIIKLIPINCDAQQLEGNHFTSQTDSLKYITGLFMWFDKHQDPHKWILQERDIDEVYNEHPEWVKKYFPQILEINDLPFYIRTNISCYLYLEGEESYLNEIIKTSDLNPEEIRTLDFYLKSFEIRKTGYNNGEHPKPNQLGTDT